MIKTTFQKTTNQKETVNLYRNIIQTSKDGFWLVSKKGKLLDVNKVYAGMSGYGRDELLKMSIFQLESKETYNETAHHIKKVIQIGSDCFESEHKRKDGNIIHVKVNTTYLPERDIFVTFIKNITNKKQAEDKKKERTLFLDKIIENSAISLWISDEKGTAIRTNPACLKFFGATEEEVIGRYNLFKDVEIEKKGYMPVIKDVFEKGKVAEIEMDYNFAAVDHVRVARATHKIIRSIFTPILDNHGKVTNVIVQTVDLTEITRTKDTLKKTAHELNKRVKELNCLYNMSKIVETIDIALEEMFQATVDLIPSAWQYPEIACARIIFRQQEYKNDQFIETEWRQAQEIIVSGEGSGVVEVYYKDKKPEIDEGPFYKEERHLINAIAERLGRIIERKQAEDERGRLLAEKEMLLKEVHHRIKNNMSTVMGMLSLQADIRQKSGASNILLAARNRLMSMMQLYDKLYRSDNFTSMSLKKFLTPLVREIVSIFPFSSSVKTNIHIENIQLDIKKCSILGIIFNELITNSIKYAFTGRDSGTITVSASEHQNIITLKIEDDGIGLPETVTFENAKEFGMQLVNMLVKQLEGSIRIKRIHGTQVIIKFEK
ncbi:PAS domain S-box protein [candidate division KSB1 bacterium]|nr:PAS domain S-box protein [candidate division KSB1 bacterium]